MNINERKTPELFSKGEPADMAHFASSSPCLYETSKKEVRNKFKFERKEGMRHPLPFLNLLKKF
jgi:hypothetical protein